MKPRTLTKLSFSFLVLIAAAACSKKDSGPISTPPPSNPPPAQTADPMALFNVSNTDLRAPVKIKFTNNSQHADTYLWEFSDGTTSTEKEPEKGFLHNGTFAVKLTATGGGKTNSKTSNVTIENAPNVMIIQKISITGIARMNGYDNPMEGSPEPDIYIKLSSGGASQSSDVVDNAHSAADLSWTTNFPFIVTRSRTLTIDVMDYDVVSTDDLMGSVQIRSEDYMTLDNRYPEEITKTENGITLKLEVIWQFAPR